MKVEVSRDAKLQKLDHVFALVTEGGKGHFPDAVRKAIDDSGFSGRAEEAITVLAGEPKRITLIGLGKEDALTLRNIRAGLYAIAKTAKKHRSANIGVVVPYTVRGLEVAGSVRAIADYLAAADYKYDAFITPKKDDKPIAISATLLASLDVKECKRIDTEARAIADGVRTVRDMGNTPSNVMTPTRLA